MTEKELLKWYADGERDFSCACLRDADLRGFDLSDAVFDYADCARAKFSSANLSGASFVGANLFKAELQCADLSETCLSHANLRSADMSAADLDAADFDNADLTGAKLCCASMCGANLQYANLSEASIDYASWPMWCGSFGVKVDRKIAVQLAYHFCRLDCDDPDYMAAREALASFANNFHRREFCGEIKGE